MFILSFAISTTASAQYDNQEKSLSPNFGTDKTFEKITLVQDGDTYTVKVEDKIFEKGTEAYSIKVDTNTLTYIATELSENETTQIETKTNLNSISPLATTIGKYIQVKAITDDPVGANLAWTTHKLVWNYDGYKVYTNNRDGLCTAANPSSLGTHWFVDSCVYNGYSIIDLGKTVYSSLTAKYHNYDFMDNSKITNVSHTIYLEGHYTGTSYYSAIWTKSGEGSSLLDLDIVVTKN